MYRINSRYDLLFVESCRPETSKRCISSQLILIAVLSIVCLCSYLTTCTLAQDEISYDEKGMRDPFLVLVTPDGRLLNFEPAGSEKKIVLDGIIYDEDGRSYAIINDEVVGVGDYITGYAVVKIEQDKVVLIKDNKMTEYILEKEEP